MQKYYWDTSIWLDLFENRDEPNFPKGEYATKLLNKIIKDNAKIIYSDLTITELEEAGYSFSEIQERLSQIKPLLIFIESNDKEAGKAKDIALKREIPRGDALHAMLARNNHAKLITFDNHFKKLRDMTIPFTPREIISN